jgi:uncharacterized protein (DUF486 family)
MLTKARFSGDQHVVKLPHGEIETLLSHPQERVFRGVRSSRNCAIAVDMKLILVPVMIFMSSAFMAVAWLGHLRIREMSFWIALAMSWAIVLPEYVLNVVATRYGYGTFTGAQMAAFHLASGVVCVTLVSRFILDERISLSQLVGFVLLTLGMILILRPTTDY